MSRGFASSLPALSCVLVLTAACVTPTTTAGAAVAMVSREADLDAEARAVNLVSRMTLAEKASQIQHDAPAIPRLQVPAYNWWNEGLHGVARADVATVFPQAIGMAATWDTDLIQRVADTVATEFRAKYLDTRAADGGSAHYRGLTVWSPNINIFRDPRWGRGQETWGEDPFLTGRFGVAYIRGLQGDDPEHPKTIAAVKHYAVHSGPEASRHSDDIHPAPRDVVETYLPAFHAAVTEAGAQALMCAYNAIDGLPACASPDWLQRRLRTDWGFEGHVVSDCGAIADIHLPTSHATVGTPEEAVALAVRSGTDLICDFRFNATADPQTTVRAVEQGLLQEAELDRALVRLFTARYRLGTMDLAASGPHADIGPKDYDLPAHRALALETARKSLVLLKNDGLLPLAAAPRRIAVIGPNADSLEALVGNYNGTPSAPSTIVSGLRARFPDAEVTFVEGAGWVAPPLEDIPDAAFCRDRACAEAGLRAEHFPTPDLQGPSVPRDDVNAMVRWGWPDREERNASIRWTGFIRAPESGEYRFRYTGDAGYRVYIDDQLVADVRDADWTNSDSPVVLSADRVHAIRIEAVQRGVRATHRLRWSRPGAGVEPALEAARQADLVVFAGGLTARLEGEEMSVQAPGFSGGDRTSLDLPAPQQNLLERLHATGKPVILVLMNGSAMSVNWADANLPAVIEAWYPGGDGGRAVAELIAGDFSPSGRLPVTFYRSADDLPPFTDYSMRGRTYRYFAGAPLYPFGYGLSYTRFRYDGARLARSRIEAGEAARIEVEVANLGDRDGEEVVQLYVSRPGEADAPSRSLAGFQRVFLAAGERRTVSFDIPAAALGTVDVAGRRQVSPGRARIWVGGGQPDVAADRQSPGASVELTIVGARELAPF
ncbi:glycoside hydrolase family 3 C-terminal domain-containing protein [Brevundimonas sp.]|uniref:glycoside hydrolase family 3 C-terminal domain-containing protein n=1 Tax=Brevundimonas sp. TaxID=1871086 RepID=UPI002D67181B|nr:glycoside hydrolase family 3 C-terminal domain-containing protein [Brevundimonas sp.]HYC96397.1 glycoside hydrolase family 3 C-terminal domain-containing protein [Brevundimonas sp.]